MQGQLKQGGKEKAEQLDKIAELEARLRVEAEEKVECLKTIAEVQGKLAEAHQETAEQLKNTFKLDAKLLAVEEEKFEYLKKISELEEELKESVKRTGKAVQVSKSEERRMSPAAVRRSAQKPKKSGTPSSTGSYPKRSPRSKSPDSAGPKSQERQILPTFTYNRHMSTERSRSPDRYMSAKRSRSPDFVDPKSQERQIPPTFTYHQNSDDSWDESF